MMQKNSNISERIMYIIDNQFKGNRKKFAEYVGFAPQVINNIVGGRKSKPSFDLLKAIITSIDDLNAEWLVSGKGEMLKTPQTEKTNTVTEPKAPYEATNKYLVEYIEMLKRENEQLKKGQSANPDLDYRTKTTE